MDLLIDEIEKEAARKLRKNKARLDIKAGLLKIAYFLTELNKKVPYFIKEVWNQIYLNIPPESVVCYAFMYYGNGNIALKTFTPKEVSRLDSS